MKIRVVLLLLVAACISYFAFQRTAESKKLEVSQTSDRVNLSEIRPQTFRAVASGVSGKVRDFAPASPEDGTTDKKSAEEKARQSSE